MRKILWLLMLLCDGFQESCRCQESRCLFRLQARMNRALNKFCHAAKTSTYPSSMSCQTCQLMRRSCSQPVNINQYRTESTHTHTRRCQAVTTVREPFSSQSRFSQRVRSMNSVSFAMLRAEKAGVCQTTQTLSWEECFVSDTSVLRRPEILSLLGITLPVPVRSRMSRAFNKLCHAERTSTCPSSMPCRC